jgi:ABC-type proline/glycine betaine transport system ATPase subunit
MSLTSPIRFQAFLADEQHEAASQRKKTPASARPPRTLLGLAGLLLFENQYPESLSGCMKQRVGIIRALTTGPKVSTLLARDERFVRAN